MGQCGKRDPTERSGESGMISLYLLFEKGRIIAMQTAMVGNGGGQIYEDLLIS